MQVFYHQAILRFPPPMCTRNIMLVLVVLAFWFCSLAFSLCVGVLANACGGPRLTAEFLFSFTSSPYFLGYLTWNWCSVFWLGLPGQLDPLDLLDSAPALASTGFAGTCCWAWLLRKLLRPELRTSCLCSRHSSHRAFSPAPQILCWTAMLESW